MKAFLTMEVWSVELTIVNCWGTRHPSLGPRGRVLSELRCEGSTVGSLCQMPVAARCR